MSILQRWGLIIPNSTPEKSFVLSLCVKRDAVCLKHSDNIKWKIKSVKIGSVIF
jgi:hypothetical protein